MTSSEATPVLSPLRHNAAGERIDTQELAVGPEDQEIVWAPGAKSYMVIPADQAEKIREQLLEADARAIITSLKQMGFSMDQAISIIEKFWN